MSTSYNLWVLIRREFLFFVYSWVVINLTCSDLTENFLWMPSQFGLKVTTVVDSVYFIVAFFCVNLDFLGPWTWRFRLFFKSNNLGVGAHHNLFLVVHEGSLLLFKSFQIYNFYFLFWFFIFLLWIRNRFLNRLLCLKLLEHFKFSRFICFFLLRCFLSIFIPDKRSFFNFITVIFRLRRSLLLLQKFLKQLALLHIFHASKRSIICIKGGTLLLLSRVMVAISPTTWLT